MQGAQQKLEQGGSVLSDSARTQLQAEIERQQRDLQRFTEDAQQDVQQLAEQVEGEFNRKLTPVIDRVAKQKGVHFVFNAAQSGLIWAEPGMDLTAEVIQAFDSPAAAAPAPAPARPQHRPQHRSNASRYQGEACGVPLDLPALLGRVYYRYPSYFIDAVTEHEPGNRLVAVKNVTVGEEFFQGHFPGSPLMPAVLTIEALTQVAAVLVLDRARAPLTARASLRGVDSAKFRRSVVPGDRLRLEVTLKRARSSLARVQAAAYVEDQVVAEAELLLAIDVGAAAVDPTAHVDPAAQIGEGTIIGPHAMIGPEVRIGKHCQIGASAVIDGRTYIGDETQIFPMASIGLAPQDLKYRGEATAAAHRATQHLSRIRHDQPRHRGGRRRDHDRRRESVHGLRPRGARLPRRQRHDLRSARDARRSRGRRGLRQRQRRIRGPSVLPRRPVWLHRRLFRGDQGRVAVRAGRSAVARRACSE